MVVLKWCVLFMLLFLISEIFSLEGRSTRRPTAITIDGACPSDPELEMLVKSKGTLTLLYIITYNNASEFVANQYAACRQSWVKVIRIPLTKYYESTVYFYLDQHKSEWRNYQYVVLSTYKSLTPSLLHPTLPPQTFSNIKEMLILAQNDIADVYPFIRGDQRLLNSSVSYHGEGFSDAWNGIMNAVGVKEDLLEKCNQMYPFYRNLYMIKPHILARLTISMKRIFKATASKKNLQALLEGDSHYKLGAPHIAKKMFGTEYYQYHPFLFQLFVPCILKLFGARICIAPLGPCGVNYIYEG